MQLRNSSNQLIAAPVTYDAASRTATLDPTPELAGSQTFTVTVSGARDLAGNAMTAVSWSFTTGTAGFQDAVLPQTGLVDPDGHPVRRRRPAVRRGEERADLRVRQSRGHHAHAGRRPAHRRAQLLGPRPARHGPAPELSRPRPTSMCCTPTTRFPGARRRGGARRDRSAIPVRRRRARPAMAASSPAGFRD